MKQKHGEVRQCSINKDMFVMLQCYLMSHQEIINN